MAIKAEKISLKPESITLTEGEVCYRTEVLNLPKYPSQRILWQSEDSSIASVNALTGTIKAPRAGKVRIYGCLAEKREPIGCITVSVRPQNADESEKSDASERSDKWNGKSCGNESHENQKTGALAHTVSIHKTMALGKTDSINAYALPQKQSIEDYFWYSDNPDAVFVDQKNNTLFAKGLGTAKIFAKSKEGKGCVCSGVIAVVIVPVAKVELEPRNLNLKKGESFKLVPTVLPQDALNKMFNWVSSDEKIVSVKNNGYVTGKSRGTAVIKAVSCENENLYGSCFVSVKGKKRLFKRNDKLKCKDNLKHKDDSKRKDNSKRNADLKHNDNLKP